MEAREFADYEVLLSADTGGQGEKAGGTEPDGSYAFIYGIWNENHELGTTIFAHKGNISTVNRLKIVKGRILHYLAPISLHPLIFLY
jgi:hypothetical protein